MAKYTGLIGEGIGYSISPAFQQAAFDALGLDVRYEIWDTPKSAIIERLEMLKSPDVLGANVTQPHKETVIPHLDELDSIADRIGAVNTIVNKEGFLTGYNTDAIGFIRALEVEGSFDPNDPKGARALILGAGGASRAVMFALIEAGVASMTIVNRTKERAESLSRDLKMAAQTSNVSIAVLPWDAREQAASSAALIVNCTKLGTGGSEIESLSPLAAAAIPKDALVYDLVYNPRITALLTEAARAGAATLGGLPMLVYQGAAAFELWTGEKPPVDVMIKAANDALQS